MCHPAVAIAFQALSIGAKYMGEEQQSKALYGYQVDKGERTRTIALDAARNQWEGVTKRILETRSQARVDIQNASQSFIEATASARTSAAAGGVTGTSVNAVMGSFARRFEDYHVSRMENLSWSEAQLLSNNKAIEAQLKGRIEGTTFAPIARPSGLGAIAQIGGAVMNAYELFPNDPMWGGS
jgi:hypothetical protein